MGHWISAAVFLLVSSVVWAEEQTAEEAVPTAEPTPAAAVPPTATASVTAQTPEEQARVSGFQLSLDLDHSVGTGTFVNPAYWANIGASLLVMPSYSFEFKGVKLMASLRQAFSLEYTLPDNATGRRVDYSDTRLGVSAPAIFTETLTGISLTPSFSFTLPISFESRLASTITRLGLSASLSRSFGKFDLKYTLGGGRGLHGNPARVISADLAGLRDSEGNRIYLARSGQAYVSSAGMNSKWSVSNSIAVTYRANEKLSFSASWDIVNNWKYSIPADEEFTSKKTDENGNPVVRAGDGRSDETSGILSAAYTLTDRYSVGFGIGTVRVPPKTADGRGFRFPFFDFISTADSLTSFSLSFSAAL